MIWAAIMAGFAAGLVHVLSGPDHLAAVAPLSLGKGRSGWRTGLQWGFGHASGVLVMGLLALLFREVLPLEAISSWAERLVGVTLIGVGAWGICKAFSPQTHEPRRAAFAIGTLHGFAGSSHLLGVVPALLFPEPVAVGAYLAAFGVGTLGGMVGFALLISAVPNRVHRLAMPACACAAVGIGCYWLII